MKRRTVVRSEAEADVDDIAATIARENLSAGIRFYDAVEATFDLLARFPNVGTRRIAVDPSLAKLRSYGVLGFRNYLVFFVPLEDGIDVVRVMHGARDHDQWLRGS